MDTPDVAYHGDFPTVACLPGPAERSASLVYPQQQSCGVQSPAGESSTFNHTFGPPLSGSKSGLLPGKRGVVPGNSLAALNSLLPRPMIRHRTISYRIMLTQII